ncbi:MAG: hypothetical protein L6420_05045 [Elusimicrobia bacterium]|nr:hypothetical protein [Elusimicrobiota bacterium]
MKKLVGIITVLALFTSVASAELLKNFKYDGSILVKNVTVDNTNFDKDTEDKYSNTKTRVVFGMNFDLNEEANAQVTFAKYNRTWNDQAGTGVQSEEDIDNLTANIDVAEAYLNLKGVLGLDHKVGRQFYGNEGDIVIYYGPSAMKSVAYAVQALDAWSGVWKKDKLTVTGVMGKVNDFSATTMRDHDVYGVTAKYDYSEKINPSAYVYQSDNRLTTVNISNRLNVAGVKVEGKVEGIGYMAEYAMNTGTNDNTPLDYKGSAMKFNADYGLNADKIGKFTFMGEYAMGSGDDNATDTDNKVFTAINSNYIPGLIYGGIGGIGAAVNLGNLTTYNVGVNFTPNKWEKLALCGKYYTFKYSEKVGTAENIGSEMDFAAVWNHSDNVMLKASYAMFTPDKDIAAVNNDAQTLFGFDVNVKF